MLIGFLFLLCFALQKGTPNFLHCRTGSGIEEILQQQGGDDGFDGAFGRESTGAGAQKQVKTLPHRRGVLQGDQLEQA